MTPTIHCILLDDDIIALQQLKIYVQNIPNISLVGAFSQVMDAYNCLQTKEIDLLISDINMPMLDGLAFVRSLKNPPLVIFQTSHQHYAVDAYEVEALDFLTKPYSFERFLKAIQRVEKRLGEKESAEIEPEFTFVKADGDYVRLLFKDIRYIESYQNYVKVFILEDMLVLRMSMRKVEEQFPAYFMRIHRTLIVNSHHVSVVKQEEIVLADGTSLILSKHFYEEVKEKVVNRHLLKG